jgi:uncharacterized membrane protein HdeD (DUF308 family)
MATTTSPRTSASPLDRHASPVASSSKSRRGTASLVLGILALLTFLIPIVAVILGVIAVVLALSSRSECRRKSRPAPWQATAGLILGSLGILAALAFFVAAVASA